MSQSQKERRQADETKRRPASAGRAPPSRPTGGHEISNTSNASVLMVGPNFRVGKKIGCGNFGELRLGEILYIKFQYCELTSGQSNLTTGRIATADGRFSGICHLIIHKCCNKYCS